MERQQSIYQLIASRSKQGVKQFAILIDPDKVTTDELMEVIRLATLSKADYFFVGGSLMSSGLLESTIATIKKNAQIPVILFPGSPLQINKEADALLFLSLISGRNPELLIGNHVIAAPYLKAANLEVIATGYILVDSGQPTTASYISNTQPIPYNKPDIAACTALAGEYLGMKLMYLDGGSGASKPLSDEMIAAVKKNISAPLIVGGGIDTTERAKMAYSAGADILVVGNAIEKDPALITGISTVRQSFHSNGIPS